MARVLTLKLTLTHSHTHTFTHTHSLSLSLTHTHTLSLSLSLSLSPSLFLFFFSLSLTHTPSFSLSLFLSFSLSLWNLACTRHGRLQGRHGREGRDGRGGGHLVRGLAGHLKRRWPFPALCKLQLRTNFILQRWWHAKLMIRVWVHARTCAATGPPGCALCLVLVRRRPLAWPGGHDAPRKQSFFFPQFVPFFSCTVRAKKHISLRAQPQTAVEHGRMYV